MRPDNKKEWFDKARLDYYSPFITLWLSCNSWYNFHYADEKSDRSHLQKLKEDRTKQNHMYSEFKNIMEKNPCKERTRFYSNLELLHNSLNRTEIIPDRWKYKLGFTPALIDFTKKTEESSYEKLVLEGVKTKTGKFRQGKDGFDLGDIVITKDTSKLFNVVLEIIYQVRCALVHGDLEPTEENHEVVKYCYLILYDLIKGFCS